jgi:hypothetical protein
MLSYPAWSEAECGESLTADRMSPDYASLHPGYDFRYLSNHAIESLTASRCTASGA